MSYVYNNTQYNILSVNAKYCEDRANVLGVCRLVSIEIAEIIPSVSNNIKEKMEREISDPFAEDEYFTEDETWKISAEKDIKKYTDAHTVHIF